MQLDDLLHQRETDAQTAVRAVDRLLALEKQVEKIRQDLRCDAHARVVDLENGIIAGARDSKADAPAGGRISDPIDDEIADDLLYSYWVGDHPRRRHVDGYLVIAGLVGSRERG